jgi:hypothetical protein
LVELERKTDTTITEGNPDWRGKRQATARQVLRSLELKISTTDSSQPVHRICFSADQESDAEQWGGPLG